MAKDTTVQTPAPTAAEILGKGPAAPAAPVAPATPETPAAPTAAEILNADRNATIARTKAALPAAPGTKPVKLPVKPVDDEPETEEPELDDEEKALVGEKPIVPSQSKVTPESAAKPGKISDVLSEKAQEAGLTIAEIKELGSENAVKLAISLLTERTNDEPPRRKRDDSAAPAEAVDDEPAPKKITPPAEKPLYEPISFDDVTEEELDKLDTRGLLNLIAKNGNSKLEALAKELVEAKTLAASADTRVQNREKRDFRQAIDACYEAMPETLKETYGTIATERLPKNSPTRKLRERFEQEMAATQLGRERVGLPGLSIPELAEQAKLSLHREVVEAEIEDRVTKRLKGVNTTKQHQQVLRPNGREQSSGLTAEQLAVAEINRALGNTK